jgi:hypothetical protein
MPDKTKVAPAGAPSAPSELARSIREAVQNPEIARGIHIRMSIEGGTAEERYAFHFEASGAGSLSAHMSCRMTNREARSRTESISREDFAELLRASDLMKLIEVRRLMYGIPPCSLLGRVEITDDQQRVSFVFMADPGQAAEAGMETPPELMKLIDKIFEVSEKYTDASGAYTLRP